MEIKLAEPQFEIVYTEPWMQVPVNRLSEGGVVSGERRLTELTYKV
jgi:hypothetical protein